MACRYRRRHAQTRRHSGNAGDNRIYSIYTQERQNEYVNVKLPYLPDYSPPMNPPSYDEIDHSDETTVTETGEPPIYEEIGPRNKSENTHVYENLNGGYVNSSYAEDPHNLNYMKI